MMQTEDQNKKVKESIKEAWMEGDLMKLLSAGFDSFMNMLCNDAPIPFQRFLEYTGAYFDKYIQDVSQEEHLNFIGGKMILKLDKASAATSVPVCLSADFYFQTADKNWVVKKKNGMVESRRFADWDTDVEASKLRNAGKMELSIEPPKVEG